MLVIAAMLKVLDDKGDKLEREFEKLVPKIRSDPGVIGYIVHRNIDDPSRFFVYEKYESKKALDDSFLTTHFQEFFKAFESIKDGEPEIRVYKEVACDSQIIR